MRIRIKPGSLRVEDKVSAPLPFLCTISALSCCLSSRVFSYHPFKHPSLTFRACSLDFHKHLHSKTLCSFPLNFQETKWLRSLLLSHTHTHTLPFKVKHCMPNTHTQQLSFTQPSLIRNMGNNVMSASIGHFNPTSKSHVGSNPHQSLADAAMRAGQQWNNN